MAGATRRQFVLVLLTAVINKDTHAASPKRLRRDLVKHPTSKSAKTKLNGGDNNLLSLEWGRPDESWAQMAHSIPLTSLSFSNAAMSMPEFQWHELQDSMSMSLQGVDKSMQDEDAHMWDVFVTDEPTVQPTSTITANPTSKPTLEPSSSIVEELLITASPHLETASQTGSPSTGPQETAEAETIAEQTALVQFEMMTMARPMNDYEIFAIFQPSCIQFLARQLKYQDSQVSNIDCKVTNQQLLGGATGSSVRRLEASSLVVDINVSADATSDAQLDDMINGAFTDKSELFVNSLKFKGEKAEISAFDELYSVTSVEQVNEKSAISSGSGTVQEETSNTGSLIVIITGVGLIVVLVAGFAMSRSKKARVVEDQTLASAGPPRIVASHQKQAGPFDFDFGFLKTLSHESLAQSYLPAALAPAPVVAKVRREVVAPTGKLGIITEDSASGVVVHSVKDESPLRGLLFPGDLIEALDNMDVSRISSSNLTKLMVSKSNYERKITVLSERLHTNYSD